MDPAAATGRRPDLEPATAAASAPVRLLVPLLALGILAAQLALRELDDGRLVSFRWVFAEAHPARLFATAAAALALAALAARWPILSRRPGAALFLGAYAVGAWFWRAPEPIVDAARYFVQAKHLELYGLGWFLSEWGREVPAWTDLPLVPCLYGLVFAALGESRLAVQALTTLLFSGAVVLTWRTGRALYGDATGLSAAALLLAIPYLPTQVPSLLVDVPTMFLVSLAAFASVEAIRGGGAPRIAVAAAALSLALFSKYSAALFLAGLPAIALAERRRPGAPRRALLVALGGALLVGAALLAGRDLFSRQLALLLGYQAPGLRRWGESLHAIFLFQLHPVLAGGAVVSLFAALRRRDARWLVAAVPVLLLLVLDVRRVRYWLPAFPWLALLGGYGIDAAIRSAEARRLVVGCAVATSLVVAAFGHLPFLLRTSAVNLKDAGAYLDAMPEPGALVITPGRPDAAVNPAVSVPILDLFTRKRLSYREASARRETPSPISPLRFTWEYRTPRWYEGDGDDGLAVVMVSSDLETPLPPDLAHHRPDRTFAADEGVFEHRTLVRVYRRAP